MALRLPARQQMEETSTLPDFFFATFFVVAMTGCSAKGPGPPKSGGPDLFRLYETDAGGDRMPMWATSIRSPAKPSRPTSYLRNK